jgi:membrane fusion protein, adhesin transport system
MSRKEFGILTVDEEERRASQWLLWSTVVTLVVALSWAGGFELDEVTKGQGKVIPASREQVVQSLDSGVVSQILVREGAVVKKDDVLIRLDDKRSGPVFREAKEKKLALEALAVRLRAEAYGRALDFGRHIPAELASRERQAFAARKQSLDEAQASLKRALEALNREIAMTEPLTKQGVVSEVELLRLKRQQADLTGQVTERKNRYATDAANELVRVDSELSQTRENASAREDAFIRTVIKAPMDGIVKNVQVTTIGGVVQAGMPILEIVPTQDQMLVEAYVKPAEVAFLKNDQKVIVKLTAYDYNRFGGLEGVLEHISPDTMRDEKQRRPGVPMELEEGYYRLLVRITDANLERNGLKMLPMPGMTATVEIKTGQKTVLEYLFRPLQNVTQALRER